MAVRHLQWTTVDHWVRGGSLARLFSAGPARWIFPPRDSSFALLLPPHPAPAARRPPRSLVLDRGAAHLRGRRGASRIVHAARARTLPAPLGAARPRRRRAPAPNPRAAARGEGARRAALLDRAVDRRGRPAQLGATAHRRRRRSPAGPPPRRRPA